jgi:hypothetical protein
MTTEGSDSKIKLTHRKAFDEEFKRLDSSQLGQIREYLIHSHDFGRWTNEQLYSISSGSLALLRDILRIQQIQAALSLRTVGNKLDESGIGPSRTEVI